MPIRSLGQGFTGVSVANGIRRPPENAIDPFVMPLSAFLPISPPTPIHGSIGCPMEGAPAASRCAVPRA